MQKVSMCALFKGFLDFCVPVYGICQRQCSAKKTVERISVQSLSLSTALYRFVRVNRSYAPERENPICISRKSLTSIS